MLTRVHVRTWPASYPTAAPLIPIADPEAEKPQIPTPGYSDNEEPIAPTIPQSRKDKRKQKKQKHDSALPTPSDTENETPSRLHKPPNNPPKKKPKNTADDSTAIPRPMPLAKDAIQKAYPLLICSIGNPGATYAKTLHSAGHLLTSYLSERKGYEPFTKGLQGLVSREKQRSFSLIHGFRNAPTPADSWTFWQSTVQMNVSGVVVKRAHAEWLRSIKAQSGSAATEGRLVVIHDELEGVLGRVSVRDGGASAKGHNGLKSCQMHLGGIKWWRVGVGIGRPESREPSVVSDYVLSKMSGTQRRALEDSAVAVYAALEQIAAGQK